MSDVSDRDARVLLMNTETVPCPQCGALQFAHLVARADGFNIVRCSRCELAYVNPRPRDDEIQALYARDYYDGCSDKDVGYVQYDRTPGLIRATPPFDWTLISRAVSLRGLRALDVGCAFGAMVYWMRQAGATATGVDLSAESTSWGKSQLGLDLRCCALEHLGESAGTFDLITMVDLIEHVPHLSVFLARVRDLLKPGGRVFVRTPNFACFAHYGDECAFLRFSLEHLLYFEPATLRRAFESAGFEVCDDVRVLDVTSQRTSDVLAARALRVPAWRRALRRLPFADLLRLVRSRVVAVSQEYRFDATGKQGSMIVGWFRRPLE